MEHPPQTVAYATFYARGRPTCVRTVVGARTVGDIVRDLYHVPCVVHLGAERTFVPPKGFPLHGGKYYCKVPR